MAIADEYDDPVKWPCDVLADSVLGGGNHGHATGYPSPNYPSGRAAVLPVVPGAWINSDWRCPEGNAAVGGVAESTHIQGAAGDFNAPNFDVPYTTGFRGVGGGQDVRLPRPGNRAVRWRHLVLFYLHPHRLVGENATRNDERPVRAWAARRGGTARRGHRRGVGRMAGRDGPARGLRGAR